MFYTAKLATCVFCWCRHLNEAAAEEFLGQQHETATIPGDFHEFVQLISGPLHGAAQLYADDPVFGNSFDGVELGAKGAQGRTA